MTTPTTNYGWLKPDPTEYADIDTYNTVLDDIDTDIKAQSDTVGAIIKPLMKWKHVDSLFSLGNSSTPYLMRDTNSVPVEPIWEEVWSVSGNVGGFSFNNGGMLKFSAQGIYRLSYNINFQGNYNRDGWMSAGLYGTNGTVLVPRTLQRDKMHSDTLYYQTLSHVSFIRVTTAGDDAKVDDGTSATQYNFGLRQDSTDGNVFILTRLTGQDPFFSTFTLEYVRSL